MFGVRRSRISISVPGHCHLQVESRVRRPGPPRVSPARRDCLRLEITIGATAQSRPSKPEVTVESNVRSTRLSMMFCFLLPGHCLSILSRLPLRTATVRVTGRHRAGPGAPQGRGINARPVPGAGRCHGLRLWLLSRPGLPQDYCPRSPQDYCP